VISSFLNTLWRNSGLVAKISPAVLKLLSCVEFFRCLIEIVFDQVQENFIVFWHNSWIFKLQNSKFMERPCNIFAFLFPSLALLNVLDNINNWDLF